MPCPAMSVVRRVGLAPIGVIWHDDTLYLSDFDEPLRYVDRHPRTAMV